MKTARLAVHHFGPDPAHVGGMASVLRVLQEHRVGADEVVLHPTWRPAAHLTNARLTLAAITAIAFGRFDVAHVHLAEKGSFVREGALVLLARAAGKTAVATIHGAEFVGFAHRRRLLVSLVLRCAHIVTCLDEQALDVVRASAPKSQGVLVPNPIAIDRSSNADETDEVVLFAGEICLRKGADVLCRAWPSIAQARPRARCVVVGPPGDFAVPAVERLEVRDPVDAEAMKALIRSARVVVLPSRAEGMPMILTEAMSAGRPFVSTPVGGIPQLAQGGGILVPVGDADALAERTIEMLANPQLARQLGDAARRHCVATRSTDVLDARLRQLYEGAPGRAVS
jgi:glycosyltransferase involved in cell wall biosynthesis